MKKIFFSLIITFLLSQAIAQDVHFSQFYSSPLTLNPALTGVFRGDLRFVGNYKNQWNSFDGYTTFAAAVDASLFKNKLPNKDFVGGGLLLFRDRAGYGDLSTTQVNLSVSYNKSINADASQYVSLGLQAGWGQRSINFNALSWGNQWDGVDYNSTMASGEIAGDSYSYLDFSVGGLWYYKMDDKNNFYAGISLFHINRPNQSFEGEKGNGLYSKISVHGGAQVGLNDYLSLLPSILFLKQGPSSELNAGTFVKYLFADNDQQPALYLGAWYRFKDAFIAVIRMDYANFSVGFNYDVNVSTLKPGSNSKGGPEASLIVIMPMPGKAKKGGISCPSF